MEEVKFDVSEEGSSTPKLALFSSPWELSEPQGMKTPPLFPPLSIPFKWEEAPGKPIMPTDVELLTTSRSLHLPPRLLQAHPAGGLDSHAKHLGLFRISSVKTRSSSLRLEFESSRALARQNRGMPGGVDSPTSILNSPPNSSSSSSSNSATSRDPSTSSQDSVSALADGYDAARVQSSALPAAVAQLGETRSAASGSENKESLSGMKRLAELWTPSLRWLKHKECDSSSSAVELRDGEDLLPHHSSTNLSGDYSNQRNATPRKRRLVFRNQKRGSTLFATILKRLRSRLSPKNYG